MIGTYLAKCNVENIISQELLLEMGSICKEEGNVTGYAMLHASRKLDPLPGCAMVEAESLPLSLTNVLNDDIVTIKGDVVPRVCTFIVNAIYSLFYIRNTEYTTAYFKCHNLLSIYSNLSTRYLLTHVCNTFK